LIFVKRYYESIKKCFIIKLEVVKMFFLRKTIFSIIFILVFCINSAADKVVFGIPPWAGGKEEAESMFETFIEYLSEKLDKEVIFMVSEDYNELGSDVSKGYVDIAVISSSAYVNAKQNYPDIEYLCSPLTRDKKHSYESYIIVRKDSGILNYKGLEGKKFAFVDENSSSGYKFPIARMIKKWGINPNTYFSKTLFLGSHPNVVFAVYSNQAAAGAVYEKWQEDAEKIGNDEIIAIEVIENIPRDGVVVSPKLDYETKQKIKNILINIDENTKTKDGKVLLENFIWGGFVEKNDSYYDIIRETNEILKEYKK